MVVRLAALHAGRTLPQKYILVLISFRGGRMMQLEGLGELKKKSIITSGLDPVTSRLIA
jgi:hypothetical protein